MNQLLSKERIPNLPVNQPIHTFSLKPLPFSGSCFVQFQADFSPRKNSESSSVSTLPSFNSDGKHFTPAFHLTSEMDEKQHCLQNFLQNFENKKIQYTTQNKHLLQPKPESRYCQVCHEYFQDYLKHTKHTVHIKKLREGTVESQILNLIHYFKNSQKSFKRNSPSEDKKSQQIKSDASLEGLTLKKKIKTDQIRDNNSKISHEFHSDLCSINHLVIEEKDDDFEDF